MKNLLVAVLVLLFSCKSGPSNTELQSAVTTALSTDYPGVTASVNDGAVTLAGSCADAACKTSSEAAVKNIKGVKSVVNNITVAAPAPTAPAVEVSPDAPLRDSLQSLLSAYKTVNGTVDSGVVTLTGTIKRSQLTTLMQSVNELKPKRVQNNLTIK